MKISMKTIASDYNEETGVSKVTIATDLGLIDGYAALHPDDAEIASRFAGCRYAEMRAGIKYAKKKAQIAKYKLQPLYKIYKELINNKHYKKDNKGLKLLEKEIYMLEDEMKIFNHHVNTLTENLTKAIESRPELVNKMIKKKQDNE